VAFQPYFAALIDLGRYHTFVFQVAEQHAGAPVDESLGETLMEGITQAIFNLTGLFAPIVWVCKPVFAVGDEGPGPDLLDPVTERFDVTFGIVAKADLLGNPISVDRYILPQIRKDPGDDLAMRRRRYPLIIGNLAAFPEQFDRFVAAREPRRLISRQKFQRQLVRRDRHAG